MLSLRTINVLRHAGITHPHKLTVLELMQVPGIGVAAVAQIAREIQVKRFYPYWPELR